MKTQAPLLQSLQCLLLLTAILGGSSKVSATGLGPDILYVGDAGDNTVKSFSTNGFLSLDGPKGTFVSRGTASLTGPRGLLIAGAQLVVINQNANQPQPGAVLQFFLKNGSFSGAWVAQNDPNAPFTPRGAVIKDGVIYVANFVLDNSGTPGAVQAFGGNGKLLGRLTPPAPLASIFRPRGVVVGPDGLLYVSSDPNFVAGTGPTTGGQVLRFDPNTLDFVDVYIDDLNNNPVQIGHLNRPEGLVFGPDGNLYVTSFRANQEDTDSIRIYNGPTSPSPGAFSGAIVLDVAGVDSPARVFAQALLFGPGGKLFVPISGNDLNHTGEVRSYDFTTNPPTQAVVVPIGTLKAPWYLTFGRTNAATLAY